MAITDWPASERPRERLLAHGAHALTPAELLAVFLRTGVAGTSAVALARQILDRFGSLNALLSAPLSAFTAIRGLGPAKFAQLQAALELARRTLGEQLLEQPLLTSPQCARDFLRLSLARCPHEVFAVLFLDARHHLIAYEEMSRGTLTQAPVYPREIAKRALELNASALILAHNHPSGHAKPSQDDIRLTHSLSHTLSTLDIQVLDHLIVASNDIASLAQLGLMHTGKTV